MASPSGYPSELQSILMKVRTGVYDSDVEGFDYYDYLRYPEVLIEILETIRGRIYGGRLYSRIAESDNLVLLLAFCHYLGRHDCHIEDDEEDILTQICESRYWQVCLYNILNTGGVIIHDKLRYRYTYGTEETFFLYVDRVNRIGRLGGLPGSILDLIREMMVIHPEVARQYANM